MIKSTEVQDVLRLLRHEEWSGLYEIIAKLNAAHPDISESDNSSSAGWNGRKAGRRPPSRLQRRFDSWMIHVRGSQVSATLS